MESFFTRYRNLIVLLAILMVQIVGLAVQVRRTPEGRSNIGGQDSAGVRLVRLWADSLVTPPEELFHSAGNGIFWLWNDYIDLRHTREQNRDLQETIARLRLEQAAMLEDAEQGERLQAMLGFQEKYIYTTLPAQAIGSSGSLQSRLFYINKGSNAGLKPDMAVITAEGIVGKIRDVFPATAQVLMVNDQTSGAGVILASTRLRGILTGNASGQLEIVGILADERIQPGERVLTAGGDLIFPRGLPVGTVEKVVRDPVRDGFIDVMVRPDAHLNRLDEVLVITDTQPRFSQQDQQDIATSQAVMGDEAQAIKDQLKASEIMAEHLPGLIDPNLPPDQQPLHDNSNPTSVAHPPTALHPDRFTPESGSDAIRNADQDSLVHTAPNAAAKPKDNSGAGSGNPAGATPANPRRNP